MRLNHKVGLVLFWITLAAYQQVSAQEQVPLPESKAYLVQPGDILEISVWKEEGLQQEVLVRPDGGLSFPLAGDFKAQGKSLVEIQKIISERLSQYIADPVITVSAKQLLGNRIYVIGKVNKPGEYIVNRYVDVMQALSMAAGMTPFSAVNDIKILRRDKDGKQQAIEFRYGDVEDGDDLEQNIILKNGDVVVVP
ncbi:MAG: polysaccharide biosynthesis/export family protein [Methylococcaceae bacterium]|nr:polysaccharide biosynthesis/export family protein [Methylococcaceae bacterium]